MPAARGRRPTKFTSLDGTSIVYNFGTKLYEYEASQALRLASAEMAGTHYALDLLSELPGLKQDGAEHVRFLITGAAYTDLDNATDEARSKLQQIGAGKLWSADAAGANVRWCYARLTAMPDIQVNTEQLGLQPVVLEFGRSSDWYSETATAEGEAINANPDTITITNPGNATVRNAVITIRGTFTNPIVTNTTTGYGFFSARDGSSASNWLKIDCGRGTVEFSGNGGASFVNDIGAFSRFEGQVGFMTIAPGDNSWVINGCTGATIDVNFYGAWH